MAAISKRKKANGDIVYDARITIKKAGEIIHRESKTFYQKKVAETWASRREKELQEDFARTGHAHKKYTWGDIARIHLDHLESQDKLKRTKRATIKFLLKQPISELDVCKITEKDITAHLRRRIIEDGAKPQTVNNDMAYITSVIKHAAVFLDLPVDLNAVEIAKEKAKAHAFVARSNRRERRLSKEEELKLITYYENNPVSNYMKDIIDFAIESARRQSEICNLLWDDIDFENQTVVVRDMKHPRLRGYTKTAKLTNKAMKIIKRQPTNDKRIFPRKPRTIGMNFYRACHILEIEDLRFHDLRHEATSRLFEAGYSIIEVQQFTLHEDWKTLSRYTHLKPENVELRD